MSKHTPGPWAYQDGVIIEAQYNGHTLASVRKASEVGAETSEANGRLMGAAPELLEALKFAVDHFEINGGEEEYTFLKAMKTAIAKAEGK